MSAHDETENRERKLDALQALLIRFIDNPHPSTTNLADDFVWSDRVSGGGGRHDDIGTNIPSLINFAIAVISGAGGRSSVNLGTTDLTNS